MSERHNPYKSTGKRTVIGLAKHNTLMELKNKEIDALNDYVKTLESKLTNAETSLDQQIKINKLLESKVEIAENGIQYWENCAERYKAYADKMAGVKND